MGFKSLYEPTLRRPHMQDKRQGKVFGVGDILQHGISPTSWLLVGASLQALAVYLFSSGRYILLLSTTALLVKISHMLLIAFHVIPNPYLKDVYEGRNTALLPEESTGEMVAASDKKIVTLHLGAKSNHPFGFFQPQFTKLGDWLEKMADVMDTGETKGFLGQTGFHRQDEKGAHEVCLISYWQSIEDLWAFAHSGVHREAWNWWEKEIKLNGAVAINHEIFEADAQHWENIYINFQPTLMGATTFLKRGGKTLEGGIVPDQWVSPLVDARRGKLAKSSGRMGREINMYDETRVAKEVYA